MFNIQKVDFIWINRDQKCFEWFINLLAQLEAAQSIAEGGVEQHEGGRDELIDMRLYMTSAASKTDMKGVGLQLALELLHDVDKRDVITGLQTRTMPGRPDWREVIGCCLHAYESDWLIHTRY